MYRAAVRSSTRALRPVQFASSSRRFLFTSRAEKRKSTWKGTALKWGAAVGAVYFYNTSPIFADELAPQTIPAPAHQTDDDLTTVDAVIAEKRKQAEANAAAAKAKEAQVSAPTGPPEADGDRPAPEPGSPAALEEEAGQQGAFNPETGEINWDCPCLGGMAHGPCGEEFKAAFSCFVYSSEEPKGMDCIDKFQHMQDCFREHPEVYGSELEDEENTSVGADDDNETPAPAVDAEGQASVEPGKGNTPAKASPGERNKSKSEFDASATKSKEQSAAKSDSYDDPAPKDPVTHVKPKKAADATAANKNTGAKDAS